MIKNYIKTAFRTLRRHPGYTAINLTGLAVGMAACLLMLLFVRNEHSVNRAFEKIDDLYRVNSIWHEQGDAERLVSFSPLAATLVSDFAGVEKAIRYTAIDADVLVDGEPSRISTLIAGTGFFSLFDFEFIAGDPLTALIAPNSAVLTDQEAVRLFGTTDAIGRTLQMVTWAGEGNKDFKVTGIIKHPAYNSVTYIGQDPQHLILPFSNAQDFFGDAQFDTDWSIYNTVTYVELAPDANAALLTEQFAPLLSERLPAELKEAVSLKLEPLRDVYLNENNGTVRELAGLLLFLAALILGVACFNFINIATAQAMTRGREVGMRRVLGARKGQLVSQYIGEALVLSLGAMLLAVFIAWLVLPSFNQLVERSLSFGFDHASTALAFLGIVLLAGIAGGAYPAFYLSSLQPKNALKNLTQSGGLATRGRRFLVVGQFVVAIGLFISAVVIHRQADFIAHQDTGFDEEQILIISSLPREWTQEGVNKLDVIKERLNNLSEVVSTSIAWGPPGPRYTGMTGVFTANGLTAPQSIPVSQVDADFLATLNIELAAGRFFENDQVSGTPSIILNESAVRMFGWNDPVGQQITWNETAYTVQGVVKDYHTAGLEQEIGPIGLLDVRQSPLYREILVRLSSMESGEALNRLKDTWTAVYPGTVFEYYFLDDQWSDLHRWIWQTQRIAGVATFLAILIACLGLLGLVSISVSNRTREIGIRKVLGASVTELTAMLVKDYLILVGIAFLITIPLIYLLMERWLEKFAISISMGPGLFIFVAIIMIILATIIVGVQSMNAALANPVDILKDEA